MYLGKVVIEDTIFTSPTRDGTNILRGYSSHAKVWAFAGKKQCLF